MKSRVLYVGDDSTRLFAVPFPYLAKSHVRVYLNKLPINAPEWAWVNDGAIELLRAPKQDAALEVVRVTTDTEALVQFQNGSVLTESELNLAVLQLFYLLQETRDAYDVLLGAGVDKIAGPNGVIGGTAQDILDNIVASILDSELLNDLQQRINDIDLNAENLVSQTLRIDSLQDVVDALANVDGQSIVTFLLDEQTARIEGDTAINQTLNIMGAKSGDSLSFVLNLNAVKVSPTESLGARLTQLQSSIGANVAAIQSEQLTRATADSALATNITTLQSTVGDHTASLQTIGTVTDGLKAQYMVKTDVNGYIAGYGLYNTGASSEFIVLADKFAVVTPGKTKQVPFVIGSKAGQSIIGINGALIVDGSIHADSINANTLSAIAADMGTLTAGKISLSGSGRSLILQGGAVYPLWYGVGSTPTEENAYFFCKNNGDVYLKGRLRGSNFDMRSTVINTGGDREAPFAINDVTNAGSAAGPTTLYSYFANCYHPDYGSGYSGTRFAHGKMDVFFYISASGGGGGAGATTGMHLERQYDNGSWVRVASNIMGASSNSTESLAVRYTTQQYGWNVVRFRLVAGGLCWAVSGQMQVYNFSPSTNPENSVSNSETGASSGGSGGGENGGGGSWCVVEGSYVTPDITVDELVQGESYRTYSPGVGIQLKPLLRKVAPSLADCVRITTECGAELECSVETPFNLKHATGELKDGEWKYASDMRGELVLVEDENNELSWQTVTEVMPIGKQMVVPVSFGGLSFPAGRTRKRRIYSHNMAKPVG